MSPEQMLRAQYSALVTRHFLQIRYQLLDVLLFDRGDHSRMPQVALALFSFTRQQVAFEAFGTLDFATAGDFESLHRPSIALDFGHVHLLFVLSN